MVTLPRFQRVCGLESRLRSDFFESPFISFCVCTGVLVIDVTIDEIYVDFKIHINLCFYDLIRKQYFIYIFLIFNEELISEHRKI